MRLRDIFPGRIQLAVNFVSNFCSLGVHARGVDPHSDSRNKGLLSGLALDLDLAVVVFLKPHHPTSLAATNPRFT